MTRTARFTCALAGGGYLAGLSFLGGNLFKLRHDELMICVIYPFIPFAMIALAACLARSAGVAVAALAIAASFLVVGTSVYAYYFATDDWWGLLYMIIPLWEGPIALIPLVAAIFTLIRRKRNVTNAA